MAFPLASCTAASTLVAVALSVLCGTFWEVASMNGVVFDPHSVW
jgi:hypothetical protein